MTMTELARALHVSRPTVSLWETGRRRPVSSAWPALAAALRLRIEEVAALVADHPPARHDGAALPSLGRLRRHGGLSQRALAERLGAAPTTVSMWETAGVRVSVGHIDELARILDVSPDDLVAPPPDPPADSRPLRRLRRRVGMSQREAAAHLGVAVGTLARYEAGERATPVAIARRMAVAYRCRLVEVLRHGGSPVGPVLTASGWPPAHLPAAIRAARLTAGMTKVGLGRAVGRSGQSVHGWEIGRCRPSPSTCRRLEVVLGLPAGRLPI
jgi:transcriptional regulator with XRE-family HTH domain